MKIIFFGTPEFSAKVLEHLLTNDIQVVAVVTKPDRPKGRSGTPLPTPVKQVAQKYSIPFYQPPLVSAPEFANVLPKYNADLFVVVAYGEIIKQHLLDMPKVGCINLHTSLLPKYRGAAPIQHSIMNGDRQTGITIMYMTKKMDAGDIIEQKIVPIGPNDTFPMIEKALLEAGSDLVLKVIEDFSKEILKRVSQNEQEVTYAPKIELEDCEIHWDKPAQTIHNLIRAVTPEPGAWCLVKVKGTDKRLKIYSSEVVDLSGEPKKLLQYGNNDFIIACGQQALRLKEVQIEGKKPMEAQDFMRGHSQQDLIFI